MVKLTAPMMSFDAAGKLGNAVVFSKWKGRNYARALVTPANPRSGGQVGARSMMRFLSQNWAALSAADKATWETIADANQISTFNAYMGQSMRNWRNFLAPSQQATIDRTGSPVLLTSEAAAAGVRQITLSFELLTEVLNWGVMIFRETSATVVTAVTNCVQVVLADSATTFAWVDTPLAAGTYYYNFRVFDDNGTLGAEETEVNATVT